MARVFAITDATTRLVTNPGFESWDDYGGTAMPDDWTQYSTPTVLVEQSLTNVIEGLYSAKMSYVGITGVIGMYQDVTTELIEGVTYYIVVTVYVEAGSCSLTVWDGGGTSNAVTSTSSGTGLQRLIVKKSATSSGIRIGLTVSGLTDVVYWDMVQVGTAYIEFIEGVQDTTFRITNWDQKPAELKGNGVWRESSISDGRTLVDAYWENCVEDITFHVRGSTSQDVVGTKIQDLFRLLQKARTFSATEWQTDPVYALTKAGSETNFRFALIKDGRLPTIPDPFSIDFLQLVLRDVPMFIEHGHWKSLPPGEGLGIAISAMETYNGRTFGNVDSSGTRQVKTTNEVYVAGKRNTANLTHIYNFDDSAGTYSSNLLDSSLPTTLFPSSTAVNDAVYFGISTAVTDSGPFASLVFDLSTGAAATAATSFWQIWDGAAWQSLTVMDNTIGGGIRLGATGVCSVHWKQRSDWAANSINGVTAYWVRLIITALTGAYTRPVQQNRDIYTITWPYVEIQAGVIGGDIPPDIQLTLYGQGSDGDTLLQDQTVSRVMVGLRSMSRGSNFTAYLNFSDEQNPSGVTVSASAFVASPETPTGRHARFSPSTTGSSYSEIASIVLDSTIAPSYRGRFRMYMSQNTSGGAFGASLNYYMTVQDAGQNTFFTSKVFTLAASDGTKYTDFGEVSIPHDVESLEFSLYANEFGSGDTFSQYCLILIPIDEWSGEYSAPTTTSNVTTRYQSIKSGSIPTYLTVKGFDEKENVTAILRRSDNDTKMTRYTKRMNGRPMVQTGSKQRLWFFFSLYTSSVGLFPAVSVQLQANQQYLNMRGNR